MEHLPGHHLRTPKRPGVSSCHLVCKQKNCSIYTVGPIWRKSLMRRSITLPCPSKWFDKLAWEPRNQCPQPLVTKRQQQHLTTHKTTTCDFITFLWGINKHRTNGIITKLELVVVFFNIGKLGQPVPPLLRVIVLRKANRHLSFSSVLSTQA